MLGKKCSYLAMGLGLSAGWAQAAIVDGPGVPNNTYTAAQLGKPITLVKNRQGHGSVAMHRGYLVVIYSKDGGDGLGGFNFLDIGDPAHPKVVHNEDTPETQDIREPHGWGMRGDVACLQTHLGMHFWDWSDVTNPKLLSYLKLPDIQMSDYDKGMWWTCWQGGYVYGGGSGNGLYIVDAKDPAKPVFIKKIPTSATGGFRIGPTFAIGNLLVLTSTDIAGFSTLDIGDPLNPKLLGTVRAGVSYAAMVNGNRIIGAGSEADQGKLLVYDISDPARITSQGSALAMGDKGGYVMFSDGYAFSGFSTKGFGKFDMSKPSFPVLLKGASGISGADEDFATALGNLVFSSSDHAGGSSIIPHQMEPDRQGPMVNMVSPRDGALKQPLTSRVGVTFTDLVDKATLNAANFTVRPMGGTALAGQYATQTGIVNFSPAAPLQPNTTYEVIVNAGGVKDYAGNVAPVTFRSAFSTGADIVVAIRASSNPMDKQASARPGLFPLQGSGPSGSADAVRGWIDLRGRIVRLSGFATSSYPSAEKTGQEKPDTK